MTRYDRGSIALAVSLSTLAGYVDALGFIVLGGFFVSFMSGNSTQLGIGIAQGDTHPVSFAGGAIALFVLGVVIGAIVGHVARAARRAAVLTAVALLLILAASLFSAGHELLGSGAMILAMGAENAVFQRDGEVSIGLTYMTGTLVKMGQRIAGAFFGGPTFAWVPYLLLWAGLLGGAVAGAAAFSWIGLHAVWGASAAAVALAAIAVFVPAKPYEVALS